jgi:adenosylhomocysteine nucleosidase
MATSRAKENPILVVAALSRELAKLGQQSHSGLALLETGEGIANAQRSLEASLDQETARAVLSIGFAGALSPELQIGDLVLANEVYNSKGQPDAKLLTLAGRVQLDWPVHFGMAVTSDEILWQAAEKLILASSLGANKTGFIDMESTAIADVCARRGLPFLIVRSITDLFDEDLPLNFNQCRGANGRIDSRKVARAALLNPTSLAGLLRIRKHSLLCAGRLAEFVRSLVPLIG